MVFFSVMHFACFYQEQCFAILADNFSNLKLNSPKFKSIKTFFLKRFQNERSLIKSTKYIAPKLEKSKLQILEVIYKSFIRSIQGIITIIRKIQELEYSRD